MKAPFILVTSLFLIFLAGCKSVENTASTKNMLVENATFHRWSTPPSAGSDIPERGIDLTITIRNWPKGYTAQYIVYNQRKSLNAIIAKQNDDRVVIEGRIVQASSVLAETSKSMAASDRLVFTNSDGDTGYIEITEWQQAKE